MPAYNICAEIIDTYRFMVKANNAYGAKERALEEINNFVHKPQDVGEKIFVVEMKGRVGPDKPGKESE